jgi:ligand-binding sensor domain-containing protein
MPTALLRLGQLVLLCSLWSREVMAVGESPPYRIEVWQVESGLPQSSVTSIVQTRDGYLWLGTFGGLVRFDGVQFKVFNPNNAPGLPSSRILRLFEDRQGTLWIATEEGHVVRYANGRFESHLATGRGKMTGFIQTLAQADDNNLWLVSSEGQLVRFGGVPSPGAAASWELLDTNSFYLARDVTGAMWISTDRSIGLWRDGHPDATEKHRHSDEVGQRVIATSRSGGCWVAVNGHVQKIRSGSPVIQNGEYPLADGDVDCMLEDHLGQLWAGTYGNGLYRYSTNGTVLHLTTRDGLPGNIIRAIYEDREGSLWVGTEGYGLVQLKPALFRSYSRQQGLSGDCVLSVCEGVEGEIWIGLNGDGVDRLKDGAVRHYGNEQGLTNKYVWSVFQDSANSVWAGTWGGGVFKLERDRFVPFTGPGELGGIACALFEDSARSLWVGRQQAEPEIVRLCDGKPETLKLQSQLPGMDVRALAEDGKGNIWIGTQGGGLYCVRQGKQTHFGKAEGLNNEFIRSLYADADNVLWIGTYGGGLNRLEGSKFTAFTTREGLENDSLGYIAEDRRGNLWCGSLGGVFRVSKQELNQFARGQIRSISCFSYTESDGLPSRECTGGSQPSGSKTRDGRLWFPTIRGVAVVDPEAVPVNPLAPPVAIEELVMEGKSRSSIFDVANSTQAEAGLAPPSEHVAATLKMPPGTQRLEFRYTGLSLVAPMKVRFKYKLEGLEEDWVEAGTRRIANYSHLQPGPYRFLVQACNNDGVWNGAGATLVFIILPHFWQTWWFRVLCGATVILLFVAAYEVRLASERKLVRMRLRIASDLHDEVGSNLGSIALLTEVIPQHSQFPSEEIAELRRIALETAGSLRDIVWFLDPAGENMEDLVLRMKDTARTMLSGITFDFQADGVAGAAAPTLHFRRNVFPMFKEILHNIVKHAHASRVQIDVKIASRKFELRVRDNGAGFYEKRLRKGNGLKNLQRRADELGGVLEVRSRSGEGTSISLSASIT